MKSMLLAAALALAAAPALAADVGLSISIGQPGFYGRINIGGYPAPRLIYPNPVIVQATPFQRAPVFLHVPRYQARHWGRYCHRYHACGEPVYFVQNDWYRDEYAPRYRERHREWREHREHEYREREYRDHDRRDWGRDRGHGRGHDRNRDRERDGDR